MNGIKSSGDPGALGELGDHDDEGDQAGGDRADGVDRQAELPSAHLVPQMVSDHARFG